VTGFKNGKCANMCEKGKGQDKMESKKEALDLKNGQGPEIRNQDFAQNSKELSSPVDPIPSLGTESLRIKSEKNKEETSTSAECKFRILVVDDNENIRDMLEDFLNFEGHTAVMAKDGEEALNIFSEQDFDIVVSDLGMPGMSGWELTSRIKQAKPEMPVVIITGWGAQLGAEDLKENKVELILSKPFNLDQVKQMIEIVGAGLSKKEI
jgi:CheY-like chemotaxis protein